MKRNIYLTGLLLTVASLLSSCGEDRTHEYIEKTEEDQWIANQMKDVYLYYQEIPELKSENYFYPVDEFFPPKYSDYIKENGGSCKSGKRC